MPRLGLATSHDTDEDILEIFEHSRATWGVAQARTYVGELRSSFHRLREYPELGVDRSELRPDIRCIAVREHRIFYVVRADHIYVVRVLHVREDTEAALRSTEVE
jgi:toxin ParE1/3/4